MQHDRPGVGNEWATGAQGSAAEPSRSTEADGTTSHILVNSHVILNKLKVMYTKWIRQ